MPVVAIAVHVKLIHSGVQLATVVALMHSVEGEAVVEPLVVLAHLLLL